MFCPPTVDKVYLPWFCHPTWTVGSLSSSPPAVGNVVTKSTGGFYHPDGSPCSDYLVTVKSACPLIPILEPVRWRGDGDDVLLGAAAVAAARAGTPPHVPRRHRRQPHQPRHTGGD